LFNNIMHASLEPLHMFAADQVTNELYMILQRTYRQIKAKESKGNEVQNEHPNKPVKLSIVT